jgi:predicted transcriptional regulator
MKHKIEEQKKAKSLRSEGKSVNEIASQLGVSKSSVSVWVRDVVLTAEQKTRLHNISPRFPNLRAKENKEKAFKQRKQYQLDGAKKLENASNLFIAGCMLYWGEGSKNRNTARIANSDPNLLQFFLKFVTTEFNIHPKNISIRIYCYSNNGLTSKEIEQFWLNTLSLPAYCIKQTVVDRYPTSSSRINKKKGKLPYGTVDLTVGGTEIVQQIFGAIQKMANFERDSWIW